MILMLKGLPASGKSTYAKELVDKQHFARVNKDDLRAMINNGKWSDKNEKNIIKMRDMMIGRYTLSGVDVVVDDTNLDPKHEKQLRELAEKLNVAFCIKEFKTSIEECLRRDEKRENPVGKKVIWRMYNQYLNNPKKHFPQGLNDGRKKAIIVDMRERLTKLI
ncbi:MAG: AAA family ATPase [Candidatus Omnitrophota bacterium]